MLCSLVAGKGTEYNMDLWGALKELEGGLPQGVLVVGGS